MCIFSIIQISPSCQNMPQIKYLARIYSEAICKKNVSRHHLDSKNVYISFPAKHLILQLKTNRIYRMP